MVPSKTKPKVMVSVRMVPTVKGVGFFAPRLAAKAKGAITGINLLMSITSPAAMSQYGLSGAGLGLSFAP